MKKFIFLLFFIYCVILLDSKQLKTFIQNDSNKTKNSGKLIKSSSETVYSKEFIAMSKNTIIVCQNNSDRNEEQKYYETENPDILPKLCGRKPMKKSVHQKIIGGDPAERNSWPWIVLLVHGRIYDGQPYCGGTLISPYWILTAAHCINVIAPVNPGILYPIENYQGYAVVNEYQTNYYDAYEFNVFFSHVIIHPEYFISNVTINYDFGLIRLKKPVRRGPTIEFPCISKSNEIPLSENETCYAVGWGQQQLFEDDPSFTKVTLHEVKLPLVSFEKCQDLYICLNDTYNVCAGVKGKTTYFGDSGGGLYCQHPTSNLWYLHGITSYGLLEFGDDVYDVFARVSSAFKWIKQTIAKHSKL